VKKFLIWLALKFKYINYPLIFSFILVFVWILYLAYKKIKEKELSKFRRNILLFLRILCFLLILLLILKAYLESTYRLVIKDTVVILQDNSGSMDTKDVEYEGKLIQRTEFAKILAHKIKAKLISEHNVILVKFADGLQQIANLPAGNTNILKSVHEALKRFKKKERSIKFIIISDGRDTDKNFIETPEAEIYGVIIGKKKLFSSRIMITDREVTVAKGAKATIKFRIFSNYKGKIPVTLKYRNQQAGIKFFEVDNKEYSFSFTPEAKGTFLYTLSIPYNKKDPLEEDNMDSVVVKVIKPRIKVFLIAYKPGFTFAVLKRKLCEFKNIYLDTYIPDLNGRRIELSSRKNFTFLKKLPDDLTEYNLIIVLDYPLNKFSKKVQSNILNFVNKGGGLAIFTGPSTFKGKAELLSPLLPARAGDISYTNGKFSIKLSQAGKTHPVTLIKESVQINEILFKKLPWVPGLNKVNKLSSVSTVLAYAISVNIGKTFPALTYQNFGSGRVLTLLLDSFYRYYYLSLSYEENTEFFDKLLANIVGWLTVAPEFAPVSLQIPESNVTIYQPVTLVLRLMDESMKPLKVKAIKANINKKTIKFSPSSQKGLYTALFVPATYGCHRVNVRVETDKKTLNLKGEIYVKYPAQEYMNISSDFSNLKEITGGRIFYASELDELLKKIKPETKIKKFVLKTELLENFSYLILLSFLLFLIYLLRRRWNLD